MKKSLEEIWRKLERERLEKSKKESLNEDFLREVRERARQEYLNRIKIYESSYNPFSSTSNAGSGGTITQDPINQFSTSSIVGESILMIFEIDEDWKYIIYNWRQDEITDLLSFDLPGSYYVNTHVSTTDRGFIISFTNNEVSEIYILGLEGDILYRIFHRLLLDLLLSKVEWLICLL